MEVKAWLGSSLAALRRPSTVALIGAGLVVATLVADATDTEGPLGPAGVYFTLVMAISLTAGAGAGLLTMVLAAVLMLFLFVGDAWSLDVAEPSEGIDLLAFVAISSVLTLTLGRLHEARSATAAALAQVDAMVRHAPVGMAFVDRDLRFLEINDALASLNRRTVADLVGTSVADLADFDTIALVRRVLETGRAELDIPYTSDDVHTRAGFYPVRGRDGTISGVGIIVRETTAEHERDVLFERVTRLQELTTALAATSTVDEVVSTSVRSLQLAVDARAVSFTILVDETVSIVGSVGYSEEITSRWCDFPLREDVPLAEAIRTDEVVACGNHDETLARYPHLRSSVVWGDSNAIAAIPLRGDGGPFGAVGISFFDERAFTEGDIAFLVAAATQCATAYQRAAAFEAERSARRAAEAASNRLRFLSESTKVLAQSLDPDTLLQRLADLAAPTLSDWCAVHLVQGDVAVPVAMASASADATAMVREMSERHPIPLDAPAGLGAVVRTGQPIVLRSVTLDAVRASTDQDELIELLSRLTSIAIVPMSFQGVVLGTVTLSNTTDRELTDEDVRLARELATRAGQAVANAQLYQERARVASTLQASLLPPSPTLIPGVDVATRFVPVADGLDVGGDFYDVFRLGTVDRPAPTWALVIGDVRGKGADAAAITGIARATVRAAALDETSPAAMLQRLNQVLLATAEDDRFASETGEPRFCTACVVTITPRPGGADLVVASGGHPLPYVRRADRTVDAVGANGGLIGVFPSPDIKDVNVALGAGDSLVLYTDGITERHEGRVFFDESGLVQVLTEVDDDADAIAIATWLEDQARGFVDATPRDDLAVLVARIPEAAEGGVIGRRFLPDDDTAAALARQFVADAVAALSPADRETAVLLASELVTNALLHGAPPVHLEVRETDDVIRISVTDEHPDIPTMRPMSQEDEHGRGLLLVEALSARWGVDARPPGKSVWFELSR